MYRQNAQVLPVKGGSYMLPQGPGSDRLSTFSFSQIKRNARARALYLRHSGTDFLGVCSCSLSLHSPLSQESSSTTKKKTRVGYIKRIYRHVNSLQTAQNLFTFDQDVFVTEIIWMDIKKVAFFKQANRRTGYSETHGLCRAACTEPSVIGW